MLKLPIVILGGHGMLGQDLEQVFSDKRTFVWDKVDVDITNLEALREKLSYIEPGTVINAAAYNAVDNAEEEQGFAIANLVNGTAAGYIAQVCKEIGATFVHYSSDYVFDGTKKEGYTEDDMPNPVSNYGRSKLLGEEETLAAGGDAFVVRTCKLFGKPGASEVSKKSFVDTMVDLAQTRDTLDVVDEEYASPTYTPDLAKQTRLLLEGAADGTYAPGIYHVTNTGACTWYEFAKEIFRVANMNITVNPVTADAFPRPAQRPKYSMLLNTKLPEMRSWQDALAEYITQRTA